MKTLQETGKIWVKNSLRAYLEGEKNLRWVVGILSGQTREEIQSLLNSVPYGLAERRRELSDWLNRA